MKIEVFTDASAKPNGEGRIAVIENGKTNPVLVKNLPGYPGEINKLEFEAILEAIKIFCLNFDSIIKDLKTRKIILPDDYSIARQQVIIYNDNTSAVKRASNLFSAFENVKILHRNANKAHRFATFRNRMKVKEKKKERFKSCAREFWDKGTHVLLVRKAEGTEEWMTTSKFKRYQQWLCNKNHSGIV